MNVTVGKTRPLRQMVSLFCWVFMPISKWSQQMRWHLTDDYRKAKPPSPPFTMFGWVKQRSTPTPRPEGDGRCRVD